MTYSRLHILSPQTENKSCLALSVCSIFCYNLIWYLVVGTWSNLSSPERLIPCLAWTGRYWPQARPPLWDETIPWEHRPSDVFTYSVGGLEPSLLWTDLPRQCPYLPLFLSNTSRVLKPPERSEIPRKPTGLTFLSHNHSCRKKSTGLAAWPVLEAKSQNQSEMGLHRGIHFLFLKWDWVLNSGPSAC